MAEHGEAVLKPLDGMGGRSIFRARAGEANLNVILETLTQGGHSLAMAQRYLPQISEGDKRILLVHGEPVDYCLARIPQGDEFRGNLAAGGRGEGRALSDRDRWIAAQVGPEMKRRGMLFVGLDVIGDYLTEVNVTSPTCIRELDAQFGLNIAGILFDAIEARLAVAGCAHGRSPSPRRRGSASPTPRRDHGAVGADARHAHPRHRLRGGGRGAGDADPGRDPDPDHVRADAEAGRLPGPGQQPGRRRTRQEFAPARAQAGPLPRPRASRRARCARSRPRPARAGCAGGRAAAANHAAGAARQPEVEPAPLPRGPEKIEHDIAMARLAAEIQLRSQHYAKRPKRKFVSASTQEYAWARYLRGWVDRVERVGNLNYPDEARRRRIGPVVISVAIRRDGSVESADIVQSSHVPMLDTQPCASSSCQSRSRRCRRPRTIRTSCT